ncbi:hypothetical protein GOODEAATRI_017166 [Goodea atripinnis]|uniref:Uncharacterized protein n=1 Tax=Goodea atripinnis TaxID=208336 RepID=A0ABV0PPB8_9TELE
MKRHIGDAPARHQAGSLGVKPPAEAGFQLFRSEPPMGHLRTDSESGNRGSSLARVHEHHGTTDKCVPLSEHYLEWQSVGGSTDSYFKVLNDLEKNMYPA